MAHLSGPNDIGHGADHLLDRLPAVGEVEVPQVDHVDAEPPQAGLGRGARSLRAAVDPDLVVAGVLRKALRLRRGLHDAPLGGDHRIVAACGERPSDEALVRAIGAVGVGGVEHGHPEVEGAIDHVDSAIVGDVAIEADEHHRAIAEGRGLKWTQPARRQRCDSRLGHGPSIPPRAERCPNTL